MVPLQRPEFAQTLHGGATTLAFRSRFQIIVFLLGFLLQSRSMSLHQFQSLSRGTCVPWPAWQSVMTHYCCCVCWLSGHQSCGFITCSSDSLFSGALLQAQCPRGKRRVASSRSNGRCTFRPSLAVIMAVISFPRLVSLLDGVPHSRHCTRSQCAAAGRGVGGQSNVVGPAADGLLLSSRPRGPCRRRVHCVYCDARYHLERKLWSSWIMRTTPLGIGRDWSPPMGVMRCSGPANPGRALCICSSRWQYPGACDSYWVVQSCQTS